MRCLATSKCLPTVVDDGAIKLVLATCRRPSVPPRRRAGNIIAPASTVPCRVPRCTGTEEQLRDVSRVGKYQSRSTENVKSAPMISRTHATTVRNVYFPLSPPLFFLPFSLSLFISPSFSFSLFVSSSFSLILLPHAFPFVSGVVCSCGRAPLVTRVT